MDDRDTQRLEERIHATEERGQLRLEVALSRIDGKLETMSALLQQAIGQTDRQAAASASQAAELRQEHRDFRQEAAGQADRQTAEATARYRELRNLVIGTAMALGLGLAAVMIGLTQVWIGGVQVGLPLGQSVHPTAPPHGTGQVMAPAPTPSTPTKPKG